MAVDLPVEEGQSIEVRCSEEVERDVWEREMVWRESEETRMP